MNYVEQREAALKEQFKVEMWWIGLGKLWTRLSHVMKLKRDVDVLTDEYNSIRSQYIRKGRKVGYSPKAVATLERAL